MSDYYTSKGGCPVHGTVQLSEGDIKTPKLGIDNKVYAGIAEGIKPDTLIQKELFDYTYRMLEKGITQVYGNLKYDDKQFEFAQRLKRNAARFAGYKSAWQTAQLKSAKPEAYAKINKAYNNLWMRSEYVHTVRSARAAQNYRKYLEDADIYPYLEYMPSKSAEPRADHKKLYGIIKPIEDSFWDTYMPPIDWGCKCSVAQRRRDTGSAELPDDAPKPPAAMRNNPGKKGELFTDEHPMITKLSKEKREAIDKQYEYSERVYARKYTLEYVQNNFLEKKLKLDNLEIEITKGGLQKSINQPHGNYLQKLILIQQLPFIFENAIFLYDIKPESKRIATIETVKLYEITVGNKKNYIVIWKYRNGNYTFHSIVDKLKE